jgi:hypothetical protein
VIQGFEVDPVSHTRQGFIDRVFVVEQVIGRAAQTGAERIAGTIAGGLLGFGSVLLA